MATTTTPERPADAGLRTAWLWGLLVLVVLAGIGLRGPWPADEPRFAQIAREMVESGQWLIPLRGGEPYPDKPPVFMWLVALAYLITGQLKVAFLVPSALAGLGTAWLVYDLGRRLWDDAVARTALLLLAITPQFLLQAKAAQIDALVCFWITLGCYGLLRHHLLGPAWGWYLAAFAAMALGIMSKGVGFLPVLLLIPLAVWGAPARVTPPAQGPVWGWRSWLGPLVLLAVLVLWLGPMLWQVAASGSEELRTYRDNILLRQTAVRYAKPWGHIQPWHYFFTQAIPTVWLPLALLLLTQWRRLARVLREDARVRVLLAWVAMVLLFFSLSRGKREVYILPALPMLALVAAVVWQRAQAEQGTRLSAAVLRAVAVLLAVAVLVLGALASWRPELLGPKAGEYAEEVADLARPVLVLGLAGLAALALAWTRPVLEQLAALGLTAWLVVACWIWPVLDPHRTPRAAMAALEQMLPPSTEVGLVDFKEQFLLYAQRPLIHFSYLAPIAEQERNAWRWMHEQPGQRVLLLPHDDALQCFDLAQARLLAADLHRRDWVLLDAAAMRPACEAPERVRRYRWQPRRMDIVAP